MTYSGFCKGYPGLNLHCFWIFMPVYRCQSLKISWNFWVAVKPNWYFLVERKYLGLTPFLYGYVLSGPLGLPNNNAITAWKQKLQSLDGSWVFKIFIKKIFFCSALRGFKGEEAAKSLVGRLEGRSCYDCQKGTSKTLIKMKDELMKEFKLRNQEREIAIATRIFQSYKASPWVFSKFCLQNTRVAKLVYQTLRWIKPASCQRSLH